MIAQNVMRQREVVLLNDDSLESSDKVMAIWKRVRSCIEHEDALVNQRMSWMWAFNGFLLAAYALILSRFRELAGSSVKDLAKIFLAFIPVLGVVLCISVWQGISAAMKQIGHLDNWWKVTIKASEREYPRLIGKSHRWFNHDILISHVLPATMTIAWVTLILVQVRLLTTAPQELWVAALVVIAVLVAYLFGTKRQEHLPLASRISALSAEERAEVVKLISQGEAETKEEGAGKDA